MTDPSEKPDTKKFPLSKICPACGSGDYKRIAPASSISFAYDRVCKQCSTRYTPPTPVWAAIMFLIIGAFLTLFGVVASIPVGLRLYNTGAHGGTDVSPMGLICPLSLSIIGILSLIQGMKALLAKH